jgi:predicted alpha/beta superfamily hydrolase
MRTLFLILFGVITFSAQAQRKDFDMPSAALGEPQNIWVQLPKEYNDSIAFGVLYVLDADGHFDYMTHYVDYLSKSFARIVPHMIVVGIRSKSIAYRYKNFTPKGLVVKADQGHADNFLTFVCDELMPEINKTYKTDSVNVLAGHSLGGLVALYALLKKPDVFTHIIAASPSVGYSNNVILNEYFPKDTASLKNQKLYFSVSDNDMKDYHANTEKLKALLEKTEWKNWSYELIPNTDHYSTAPVAFYKGLIAVFKK